MNRDFVLQKTIEIASNVFECNKENLNELSDASVIENWTSLTFMQMLTNIEEEFNFKFKITELILIKNIGGIVDVVMQHMS